MKIKEDKVRQGVLHSPNIFNLEVNILVDFPLYSWSLCPLFFFFFFRIRILPLSWDECPSDKWSCKGSP